MKKSIALFAIECVALFAFATLPTASMGQNRQSVVHEAFRALSPLATGGCSQSTCVGTWNYLDSDLSSYSFLESKYGCASSDWALSGDGSGCYPYVPVVSFYSNPAGYGYSTFAPPYALFARGGQCTYFANLVVYRSGVFRSNFPSLVTMWNAGNANIQAVQIGDVLQRYDDPSGAVNHIAIAVAIFKTGSTVTSVDVIDSNWISDTGAANHEVIARHNLLVSTLQGHFKIWTVPGY